MTEKEIVSKADDITVDKTAATAAVGDLNFCSIWPQAKTGLELLKKIIKNPIAKGAITLAIDAGDAVASKVCPK